MRRPLAAAVTVVLVLAPSAAAHITISPPFVEDGTEAVISFSVPNERASHATVAVAVSVPTGISIIAATAPSGWSTVVDGSTVTWSGGRIESADTVVLPLRVLARIRAGTVFFSTRQTYDDGASVRWNADLSVLPATGAGAPNERPWAAILAGLVGIMVIAGTLLAVRLLRSDHFK